MYKISLASLTFARAFSALFVAYIVVGAVLPLYALWLVVVLTPTQGSKLNGIEHTNSSYTYVKCVGTFPTFTVKVLNSREIV